MQGVNLTGSIGILAACARAKLLNLDEANALLTGMIAAGFHSPVSVLDGLI
jgi:predicted nucleic acid-binding protein